MFSGIVEAREPITSLNRLSEDLVRIHITRPTSFDDLQLGDSVAVDGVCLTIESLPEGSMVFAVAKETLQLLDWAARHELGVEVNLERSLKAASRVHGHMVSGHVDALCKVVEVAPSPGQQGLGLRIQVEREHIPYILSKGSVALQGVSLTVNQVHTEECTFDVWLIPETLQRTNLAGVKVSQRLHLELDQNVKTIAHFVRQFMNANTRG